MWLVIGTVLGTWASFLLSLVTKQIEIWPFLVVLIITALYPSPILGEGIKRRGINKIFWITIIAWGVFLVKLFSQMMVVKADGIWAGGSNVWGDWAVHIGYIANWLYGKNFPPQNPFYAGIRLSYPFLFDFTSAILAKMGISVGWSLQLPGMIFGIILVVLLFRLTEKITQKQTAAAIAVMIFMFSGGLGWIYLGQGAKEATHYYEKNIQWVNFVISEMVPQRGILIGLCAALVVFILWWEGYNENNYKKYFLAGILAGLIPFFHAHTFMVLAAVSGFLFLLKPKKIWWYFFLPAGILALPQFAYFTPQVSGYTPGFMRWQLGWTAHVQNDNWVWFWIKNIGIMFLVIPLAWINAWKRNRKLFWIYLPFLLIFIACNLWVFQPWENDNSKLLRFWYLASAILAADWLVHLRKIFAVLLLVSITLAGAIDAGSWLNFEKNKLMMWSKTDIILADWVKANTAKDAVFLTADTHNHWVVDLAGRKIVMGFKGWLWSWGINYSTREKDVEQMWNNGQIINSYNISYVVIGPGMKDNFSNKYPLLLDRFGQKIFDVRSQR